MRLHALLLAGLTLGSLAFAAGPTLVPLVHAAALAGDFTGADRALNFYRTSFGVTPEYIEAFSWIGRGQLAKGQIAAAEANAAEVRKLCDAELTRRKLDAEPHLPIALGAAIEVQAQALALDNQRDQAVVFLKSELKHWQATSITLRIQKNLNLLTLEGKPAPVLDIAAGIGSVKPLPLSAHKGHPVLLFLWAHWCPDCKAEVKVIQQLMANYGPRGLVLVAPTRLYGYVAHGEDAPPAVETKYINEIFAQYYAELGKVEMPLSERNFTQFGVSTTPTMVLVDGQGIVRVYNPGALSYEALAAKTEQLLR